MYSYESNTIRWKKYTGQSDVRHYQAPRGWKADADLIEYHPVTGEFLNESQWWIKETKI